MTVPIRTIATKKRGYEIFQFSGPVIMDHSDIPPIPAKRVRGMKMVVIKVRRLTVMLVLLARWPIWLFSIDKYISMRLVTRSREASVISKDIAR